MKNKMKLKKVKSLSPAFSAHKVTIKAIQRWNGHAYIWTYPCEAIKHLSQQEVVITVLNQRAISVKILIECSDNIYERIKLDFVCMMGDKFIWKD